jgi:DNA-binding Xre family transcriptional regulator
MNKGDLRRAAGISAASVAKLSKGKNIQTEVLAKICAALNCDSSNIMEFDSNTNECDKKQ